MKVLIETVAFVSIGFFLYVIFSKKKMGTSRRLVNTSEEPGATREQPKDRDIQELEEIIEAFSKRGISYCAYNIITERHLTQTVRDIVFADREIEFGNPNIALPAKFLSGIGRQTVVLWLNNSKGISLEEGDSLVRELSKYLMEQSKSVAEQLVAEAINKVGDRG